MTHRREEGTPSEGGHATSSEATELPIKVGGPTWYSDAAQYWDQVEPTVEGMLGGFGQLTDLDSTSSLRFIDEFINGKKGPGGRIVKPPRIGKTLACDCGAGIGRVSKNFLLKAFDRVDLVEQNPKFLEEAEASFLGKEYAARVDRFIPKGLQEFSPEEGRYDLIWTQWVLGHLTDDDFIAFFQRCKQGLKPNGLIGVKENVTSQGVDVDKEDSSVTRSNAILKELFAKAGLRLIKEEKQKGFPQGLYGVYMYMLE
ncbi:N-terminal protein methyltransferase [Spizellomyces punctatus DAOM BR117]|uniref:Alpha N-terminal protein methyltransferase 1 n=1 Tax=Spizellomyces punctatus (strain DAOM BR117) TaxID=645134 RepID=A0A0L0HM04_SPIPD|nr:N-terminal protein methyltransferase [Spizellomyces punctatus DAOM BR117]KND01950.1 hypothetical protein SPPG_09025 [Spizellomyces punctatus DAOM BR117]|eukprot:XP_016609989.1 hypothetical protein SPPG_09025 [Spizellomyces punctatus DAOM BR117]